VLLGGGIWQIIRFVAVFVTIVILRSGDTDIHLYLLWFGGPALALAALFFSAVYHPDRTRGFLPVLRIGGAVAVLADVLMVVRTSYGATGSVAVAANSQLDRFVFSASFVVLAIDLLLVALLLWHRPAEAEPGETDEDLPDYDSQEVERAQAEPPRHKDASGNSLP
jgi:hypothetical protein